jgi:hypothetical protein
LYKLKCPPIKNFPPVGWAMSGMHARHVIAINIIFFITIDF